MGLTERTEDFQTALDFAILKRQLERWRIMCGGAGMMACLMGISGSRGQVTPLAVVLGLLLIAAAVAPSIVMTPLHLFIYGILAISSGVSLISVRAISVATGGSPMITQIVGFFLAFGGVFFIDRYRQFRHLREADAFVRQLRPANPKREKDVVKLVVEPWVYQPDNAPLVDRSSCAAKVGQWTARLLPHSAILMKDDASRAIVLEKTNISAIQEAVNHKRPHYVEICFGSLLQAATMDSESAERLEEWRVSSNDRA